MAAHEDLRELLRLFGQVTAMVPYEPLPGSPRSSEIDDLVGHGPDTAPAVSSVLRMLNEDMQLACSQQRLTVAGVADLLEIAATRNYQVNGPALAQVTRSALELAGQIVWILSDQIGGGERARRYLTWRFADLRAQRLLFRDFRTDLVQPESVLEQIDTEERLLADLVAAAGWTCRRTAYVGNDIHAAALIAQDGATERQPSYTQFVRTVSSTPATYGLLSVASHSNRFGMLQGATRAHRTADGRRHQGQMGGFPLPINLLIRYCVLSVNLPGRILGGWNGIPVEEMHAFSNVIMTRAS